MTLGVDAENKTDFLKYRAVFRLSQGIPIYSAKPKKGVIRSMITQGNFVALLELRGFTKNRSVYGKSIGSTSLSVDIARKIIHYPESDGLAVNERQTCNFSANENFVVFECVHRLLTKGYKPDHIELEPKWKIGNGGSGGRAEILIRDNFGNPPLIIDGAPARKEAVMNKYL